MYCHVDQEIWKPSINQNNQKPILLFVGNDVIRKGLDFMIDIYTECLSDLCNLRIISQDPQAALFKNICGVEVYSDLYLKLEFDWRFNSQPEPGKAQTDESFIWGLGYSWSN